MISLTRLLVISILVSTLSATAFAGTISIQCDASGYTLALGTGAHSQSVQFFTYVADDATPVAGASVIFTMTYPDGTIVQKSARTDTDGRAKATFRLDQAGDYTLNKSVTVGAQTAACTETFSVTL
jgi:hypothetical protein